MVPRDRVDHLKLCFKLLKGKYTAGITVHAFACACVVTSPV